MGVIMEYKKEHNDVDKKGSLILEDRRKLVLTGVAEVINFDDKQINLNTNLGILCIKGEELKMTKLDVQNGDVVILGKVNSVIYSGNEARHNNQSILSRLFR